MTELIPRLDAKTQDALHFSMFGDERESGDHFRTLIRRARLPRTKSWLRDEFYSAAEEERACRKLGIDENQVPCIAFLIPPGFSDPILLPLPRTLWETGGRVGALQTLIGDRFNSVVIEELARDVEFDRTRFRDALHRHCQLVLRQAAATKGPTPFLPVTITEYGNRIDVERGPYRAVIKGASRMRLFLLISKQPGQDHAWRAVSRALARLREPRPDGSGWMPELTPATLQRTGRRIREQLGELGCYWQQDDRSVRWNPPLP